jgi:hypothetical protein
MRGRNRDSRLAPALRLVGHILNADWKPGAEREWPAVLFQQVDWPTFSALVWQHKLRPMAVAALREAGWPGVPAAVRDSLESDAESCVVKGMQQLAAQRSIAQAASAAGIRFIALKGVALSLYLYRDPLIRESFDFDLVVSPGETREMKALLRGLGFDPLYPKADLTPRQTTILTRYFPEEKFISAASGVVVDVHHALNANPWRMAVPFEELWRNHQTVGVGRSTLPIPGGADLIQYLCAHAATHAWERWKWIGDLRALYRQAGTSALLAQQRAARAEGWADLFGSSLLLTGAVTGWEVPPVLREIAGRNRTAVRLARRALVFSARPATRAELTGRSYKFRQAMFRLRLRKRPRYIAHELAAMFHRQQDWHALRLGDRLIPVYYLLRPILFVRRHLLPAIRGVRRRLSRAA